MAEHNTLTGSSLHENKGVASATDNTVATASSGATVWQKLTASNLTGTGNPFGAQLLHVTETTAANTNGGTVAVGTTYTTRVLNTVKTNEISGASLASNQITLPAGTYYLSSRAFTNNSNNQLRLRNITDSTTIMSGDLTGGGQIPEMCGRFTLSGTKVLELQHWVTQGGPSGTLFYNNVTNNGESVDQCTVTIWKVA